jgi:hypothetical protein
MVLCTSRGLGWDAAGARKEAVGSLDGVLPPAGDLWMEPVISSLAGACFSPLVVLTIANMLNIRITAAKMLNRVLRLGVSQGIAKRFRIGRAVKPEKARCFFGVQREGKSYSAAA